MPSLEEPRFLTMEGEIVDPFDSLDSMIKHEDLQKFVLFKTHYRKYMDVSVAYEDLMNRLESYEDELDHAKNQELKALEDLETLRTLLREKDVVLQKKEDELFAADEKITQLECDLDEERGRGSKIKTDLTQLVEEKQNLCKQLQAAFREKSEIQLRLQVEKSKCSEGEISRSSENAQVAKNLEDVTRDRERWRAKWEDLYSKVKALESHWRENRELQGLIRAGIEHLANCSRPSSCRMCCRVRDSYVRNGLISAPTTTTTTANGTANGTSPTANGVHRDGGHLVDSRRKHANLLRSQYQRLTHVIGTLLPAPIATFDPGLDGPLRSKDDSGFVDGDGDGDEDEYGGFDGMAAGAAPNGRPLSSSSYRRLQRRQSFNGVPAHALNGTASKEHATTTVTFAATSTQVTTAKTTTTTVATTATATPTVHKSAFLRMSRLTKSFGHSEKDRLRSPAQARTNGGLGEDALEEVDGDGHDGPHAASAAANNKHKMGPVRKFFSRMSVRDEAEFAARAGCELSKPSCSSTSRGSMLERDEEEEEEEEQRPQLRR